MSVLKALALFCTVAAGSVLPRAPTPDQYVPDGSCCFTLHDASTGQIIQQDRDSGNVYLDASQQDGWYCLDLADSRGVLRDDLNNACIISGQDRFSCLDPTIGFVTWSLDDSNDSVLLAHDGGLDYNACPTESGGEQLWGDETNTEGCRTVQLEAQGLQGTCSSLSG